MTRSQKRTFWILSGPSEGLLTADALDLDVHANSVDQVDRVSQVLTPCYLLWAREHSLLLLVIA